MFWQLEGAVPTTEASALFDFGPEDVEASFRYGRDHFLIEPILLPHNPRLCIDFVACLVLAVCDAAQGKAALLARQKP